MDKMTEAVVLIVVNIEFIELHNCMNTFANGCPKQLDEPANCG
jgi:hypothetical protein